MASGDRIQIATYSQVEDIDTRVTTLEDNEDSVSVEGAYDYTYTNSGDTLLSYSKKRSRYNGW